MIGTRPKLRRMEAVALMAVPDDLRVVIYDSMTRHSCLTPRLWHRARLYVYYTYNDTRSLMAKAEQWVKDQRGLINLLDEIRVLNDEALINRVCEDYHPDGFEGALCPAWHQEITGCLVDDLLAVREERDHLAKMIPRNEQKEAARRPIEIMQRRQCWAADCQRAYEKVLSV